MTSPHWKRFAWFCLCLTLSHPAWSAGGIDIPGYAPAPGVERSYRVQKATETDMSFWFDKPVRLGHDDARRVSPAYDGSVAG
ncbi:hypothetical protein HB771_25890 [Rhizobium leguminosarum bv. viciae]|nr:hypothetical protein HB771_25890 [Rhizobium leguminosarum bv. viciae]